MKIVFFGTSDFAVKALECICLSTHQLLYVVTACDRHKGRGQKISFSPVKIFAQEKNLSLLQPVDITDAQFIRSLEKAAADLFVVCAFGKILKTKLLQIPRLYAINLHTSLLPEYRGAAPVNWAIIKGESQTGLTVFKMNAKMDEGEIILQRKVTIEPQDTAVSLAEKIAQVMGKTLLEAIDLIEKGAVTLMAQDETLVSYAPKLNKEDGLIDWQLSALEIHNRIRGLQPWPGAFTYWENKILKIWKSKVVSEEKTGPAAQILQVDAQEGILIQTGDAGLLVMELQLEGKRKMTAGEFILGHPIKIGTKLGKTKGEKNVERSNG